MSDLVVRAKALPEFVIRRISYATVGRVLFCSFLFVLFLVASQLVRNEVSKGIAHNPSLVLEKGLLPSDNFVNAVRRLLA